MSDLYMHKFRGLSELKNEAKGGYIEDDELGLDTSIPYDCQFFYLELKTAQGLPHTHVPFITAFSRWKRQGGFKVDLESYRVRFNKVDGKWQLDTGNHPYLPKDATIKILGPKFDEYGPDQFKIGSEGLRLTVAKLKVKGNGNKNEPNEAEMKKFRQITDEIDHELVKIELSFYSESEELIETPRLSNLIVDKAKYDFEISDVSPRSICHRNEHVIQINLEKGTLTNPESSKLTLFDSNLNSKIESINGKLIPSKTMKFLVKMPENILPKTRLDLKMELNMKKDFPTIVLEYEDALETRAHELKDCVCETLEQKSIAKFHEKPGANHGKKRNSSMISKPSPESGFSDSSDIEGNSKVFRNYDNFENSQNPVIVGNDFEHLLDANYGQYAIPDLGDHFNFDEDLLNDSDLIVQDGFDSVASINSIEVIPESRNVNLINQDGFAPVGSINSIQAIGHMKTGDSPMYVKPRVSEANSNKRKIRRVQLSKSSTISQPNFTRILNDPEPYGNNWILKIIAFGFLCLAIVIGSYTF